MLVLNRNKINIYIIHITDCKSLGNLDSIMSVSVLVVVILLLVSNNAAISQCPPDSGISH